METVAMQPTSSVQQASSVRQVLECTIERAQVSLAICGYLDAPDPSGDLARKSNFRSAATNSLRALSAMRAGKESLRNNHKQDAKMAFVQKSIITMALGLDSMQRAICPSNKPGLCPEMLPVNGSILLQHLMNVSFSFLNEEVYFDEQGDSPGKYEILNFQRSSSNMLDSTGTGSLADADGEPNQLSADEKRKLNPLYDSYSTLKVYRHKQRSMRSLSSQQAKSSSQHLQKQGSTNLPASGYSKSNGYEYVHVASWKSSDGLSLFERIRWYSRRQDTAASSANWAPDELEQAPQADDEGLSNVPPQSVCSLPCAKGHAKVSYLPAALLPTASSHAPSGRHTMTHL